MNYRDALGWLYGTQVSGIKLKLENITRLLERLGIPVGPVASPRILHVAGTNGKGSVCAMADAICRAEGLRTGLFTSPHLVTYRERIRIDGEMIPEEEVAEGLTLLRDLTADWEHQPTFFEYTTALAFRWFQREKVKVIVLETGLGGRLDSTNAITPAATAITPISIDHTQYLGNTLAAIAGEKAGIFKAGVPALSSAQVPEAAGVLEQRAAALGIPLTWITEPLPYPVNLPGEHQRANAALAVALLQTSGVSVSEAAIRKGLAQVSWPGRFQRMTLPEEFGGLELTLDGAHNEASAAVLVNTWQAVHGDLRPTLLIGSLADKDFSTVAHALLEIAGPIITTAVANPRTRSAADLADFLRPLAKSDQPVTPAADIPDALRLAVAYGRPILATGSLFLLGDLLTHLQGRTREFASAQ